MAKIGVYEMRDYKEVDMIDGVGFLSKIFKDGKEIGTAHNNGGGGATIVHIDRENRKEYESFIAERYDSNEEKFIGELEELTSIEKDFIAGQKKGYDMIAYLEDDISKRNNFKFPMSVCFKKGYDRSKLNEKGYDKVMVFEKLEDFCKE